MKRKFYFVIEILMILILFTNSIISYAGFADYDDATADAESKNQLEQQEKEQQEKLGKSSDNYLSELSVKGYNLTPAFDKQTIEYNIEQEITDRTIEITAVADDTKAKISGTGIISLQSGENSLRIDVEAENGSVRTYFIKVNKKVEDEELKLSSIKLTGLDKYGNEEKILLNEEFNKDTYVYTCNIYSNIADIVVEPTTDNQNVNISVSGNNNLKDGKNIITITLKNFDNKNEVIYKIEVNRKYSESSDTQENKDSNIYYITIGIIILMILVALLKNKKKSKH